MGFLQLFGKKEKPHDEYMRLKLELEEFTILFGIDDLRIIGDIDLDLLVGEERRIVVREKQDRMMELYHQLSPEEKAYQDDVFDELRNKVS